MIRTTVYSLLLAVLLSIHIGCGKSAAPAAAAKHASIIISCDTAGWIVPCGCTANQSGGILRRATYLNQQRADAEIIYADAGGAPAGNSPYQQMKFESILSGEILMGISAHNLGASELGFGAAKLREIKARTGSPLLSANARDAAGALLADAVRIVPLAGKRVAIVGLVSPTFATGSIRIDDPRLAMQAVESAHQGEYDSILVLAYFPEDELQKFAAASPEVDAVIGGPTGQSIVPRRVGPTLLGAATNKGKFMVKLAPAAGDAGGWTGEIVEMGPSIGNDRQQMQNLSAYLARLRKEDFSADQTGLAPPIPANAPVNYRVGGSASCIGCHSSINTSCQATHHANAWATLVGKGFEVDSYCQKCHTTGYGLPGGFQSRSASMPLATSAVKAAMARRRHTSRIRACTRRSRHLTSASAATTTRTARNLTARCIGRKSNMVTRLRLEKQMTEPAREKSSDHFSGKHRLLDLALLYLKFGSLTFGGPAAHIAMTSCFGFIGFRKAN